MEIRNIIVGLSIDLVDPNLAAVAVDMARHHKAHLTGFVAAQPPVLLSAWAQATWRPRSIPSNSVKSRHLLPQRATNSPNWCRPASNTNGWAVCNNPRRA